MKRNFFTIICMLLLLSISGCKFPPPARTVSSPEPVSSFEPVISPEPEETQSRPSATTKTTQPPAQDISGLPALDDLSAGWNQIDPGGDTACARGGKYSFFVRKADSKKLLIYFEGGGSCYDANTCKEGAHYFDDSIDPKEQSDNPAYKTTGVFALDDQLNPFKDYNIVFIPYCTGDAFLGSKVVDYKDGDRSFKVNHLGFVNTRVVLDWTYQNFLKPDSIFMIGCSAGVVGSFFHAPYILEQYKTTPLVLVGDSGGGYLDGPSSFIEQFGTLELLPNWLPQYQDMVSDGKVYGKFFFSIPARAYPNARFGLLDTQEDNVQAEIISRFDKSLTLSAVIERNLASIRAEAPNFYSYTGPGDYHCITMHPSFRDYQVGDIKLTDWLTGLASGQPVENVAP